MPASGPSELLAVYPEQFGEYLRSEIAKWSKLIKDIGMTPQTW